VENPGALHELGDVIQKKLPVFQEKSFVVCREIFSEVAGPV